jgi:hypothetical protein
MVIDSFNQLEERQKINIVWNEGTIYLKNEDEYSHYVVYRLFDFFVEVKYDKTHTNAPVLRVFPGNTSRAEIAH